MLFSLDVEGNWPFTKSVLTT